MKLPGGAYLVFAILSHFVPSNRGIWVYEKGSEPPQWFESLEAVGSGVSKRIEEAGIKVMLVGDSIDRYWFYAACSHYNAEIYHSQACGVTNSSQHHVHGFYSPECARKCVFPSGTEFYFVHILGVALDGPYGYEEEGNYMQRVNFVMDYHGFSGNSVSTVIVSSLLWDLLRIHGMHPELQEKNFILLPSELLADYKRNCTSMLQWISSIGFNRKIFHTTRPTADIDSVRTEHRFSYIAQLNDVARHVTKELGWTVFDFEHQLTLALRDHHHPQDWFYIQSTHRMMAMISNQKV